AADVFVSPIDNIQESFGLTVVEAMACGLPQVVPDWNGYRDTVIDGDTGFLIPTYWAKCDDDLCNIAAMFAQGSGYDHFAMAQSVAMDIRAYRDALRRLIYDEALRLKMSDSSVRRSALFSWAAVIDQH